MTNATLEAKIGKNEVYYSAAPFNKAYDSLKAVGAELISPEKLAKYRAKSNKNSSLWQNGSYVNVGVIYANNQIILVKGKSPITESSETAKAATEAHRKGIEYLIAGDVANKYVALAQKGDKSVFVVKDRKSISTGSFDKSDLAIWLFGSKKFAKAYGASLREKGVKEMPLNFNNEEYIKRQEKPYANQLWLGSLGFGSLVNGCSRSLDCGSGARGVRSKKTAEGSRAANLPYTKPYTNTQLEKQIALANAVKAGSLPNSKLENLVRFLENLRVN